MDDAQISYLLWQNIETRGLETVVIPADGMPDKPCIRKRPCCYVMNTQRAEKKGEHWVVCFFNKPGKPNEYFDSFGVSPRYSSTKRFLGKNYVFNSKMLQFPISTVCGQYVLIYILLKCRGYQMKDILSLFEPGTNLLKNDSLVNLMVRKEFGVNLPILDWEFIEKDLQETMKLP